MKKKIAKGLVVAAMLTASIGYNAVSVYAAPKEIHTFRPLVMWDYYKTNYTEDGAIRIKPNDTTFSTTRKPAEEKVPPYLTIEDTDYGDDVVIKVDSDHNEWLKNIYRIEWVDQFTDNPNQNVGLMYELEDGQIKLLADSPSIQRNGRHKIKIYSTGEEAVNAEIHIVKDAPEITVVPGFEPVTDADILFKLNNFSYATENPVYEVYLNDKLLKGDCEEYHVFVSLIRLENDGIIKTPGNYTLKVKMNGYKDAEYTFKVNENDGSYIPPEYVFPDEEAEANGTLSSKAAAPKATLAVDAVTSSSLATGGGSTGSGSSGGGRMIPANIIYDFDLLANAQILKQLGFETAESKEVLTYYYTSTGVDAATLEGSNRIIDWEAFITAQAAEKAKGNFMTFEEYMKKDTAVDYVNKPYQVKYMLNDGLFGDILAYDAAVGKDAPTLNAKQAYKGESIKWDNLDEEWIKKIVDVRMNQTYLETRSFKITSTGIELLTDMLPTGTKNLLIRAVGYEEVRVPVTVVVEDVTMNLEAEPKEGDKVVLTGLTDGFIDNLAAVSVNGDSLFTEEATGSKEGTYFIQGNKIIIMEDVFKLGKHYNIVVSAYGYENESVGFTVTETAGEKDYTLPTVVTTNAIFNNKLEIQLQGASSFWKNSVDEIEANDGIFAIEKSGFSIEGDKLTITDVNKLRRGTNKIVVKAKDFVDLEFNIDLTEQTTTFISRADKTDGIVMSLVDDFKDNVKVYLNDSAVELSDADFSKNYRGIIINASAINAGENKILLTSDGFEDITETVMVYDFVVPYAGDVKEAKTLTVDYVSSYSSIAFDGEMDIEWKRAITGYQINGESYDSSKISISADGLSISGGVKGNDDIYNIVISAYGYEDTTVTTQEEVVEPELKIPGGISITNMPKASDVQLGDSAWYNAITEVKVNGVDVTSYLAKDTSNGKYYIDGRAFDFTNPETSIEIKADGYKDYSTSIAVKAPLAINKDHIELNEDNVYERNEEINFVINQDVIRPDFDVFEIIVDGASLDASKYDVERSRVSIKENVLTEAKAYAIVVRAKSYEDTDFTITLVEGTVTPVKNAPSLTADDIVLGNDLELIIPADDRAYASAVRSVSIDGNELDSSDYKATVDKLVIYERAINDAGTKAITITADGYTDQIVNVVVKAAAPMISTNIKDQTINTDLDSYEYNFTASATVGSEKVDVEVKVNGAAITSTDSNYVATLNVGDNTITVKAVNADGIESNESVTITVVKGGKVVAIDNQTTPIGNSLTIPITDNELYRNITSVSIDGNAISGYSYYNASSNNITFYQASYPGVGTYEVKIVADGYETITFDIEIESMPVPNNISINNENSLKVGDKIEIRIGGYSYSARENFVVKVDGTTIGSDKFDVNFYGELVIDASVIATAGDYELTIEAPNYDDFIKTVTIAAAE